MRINFMRRKPLSVFVVHTWRMKFYAFGMPAMACSLIF